MFFRKFLRSNHHLDCFVPRSDAKRVYGRSLVETMDIKQVVRPLRAPAGR
jgi:hypothetical protein